MASNEQSLVQRDTGTAAIVEQVIIKGDLSKLSPSQRVDYYQRVCQSLGLNPLTKPFDYINLRGKLVLYPTRDATDQLRKVHGISIHIASRQQLDNIFVVTAQAKDREGRDDEATGAVAFDPKNQESIANAMMKAETKAKRRVTLSIVGLGWLEDVEGLEPAQEATEAEQVETAELSASEKQLKYIWSLAREIGWDEEDVRAHIKETYGASSSKELTKEQASEIIEYLAGLKELGDSHDGETDGEE